jgi:uncharacterized lipoprotein
MTGRRLRGLAAALAVAALAACASDQEPELVPADDSTTATTSQALAPCPPGGPDATTPGAGCLDEDGTVLRP